MSRAAIVATIVASILTFSSPSLTASHAETVGFADKMSGAFKCSIYASLFHDQKEQKRLFQIGLKAGRDYVEALKSSHSFAGSDEMTQYFFELPTDFMVGHFYSDEAQKAYDDIPQPQRFHSSEDNTAAKL
jgi:hypothetical protein